MVRRVPDVTSYATPTATSATRSDTPIMQTPLSVQVVPNQVIRDQQAVRLPDITRNVSGVQTNFGTVPCMKRSPSAALKPMSPCAMASESREGSAAAALSSRMSTTWRC